MKTKFKINLIQKLKAQLIIFYYENIFSIFSNRLEIERLQIRSSIKNIDDCKHTKRVSEASKFLHSIKKKSKSINSLSDYLESLPDKEKVANNLMTFDEDELRAYWYPEIPKVKTDISKELETRQVDAQEAAKKTEQLRKDLEDEAARRKEEEEIEAAYLEHKYEEQRRAHLINVVQSVNDNLQNSELKEEVSRVTNEILESKKKSKSKTKKQNEKSNSEPKKKSVTKDKPTPTRKKAKKD